MLSTGFPPKDLQCLRADLLQKEHMLRVSEFPSLLSVLTSDSALQRFHKEVLFLGDCGDGERLQHSGARQPYFSFSRSDASSRFTSSRFTSL
ncbi:hypothetical protein CgunFtcFv8_023874 [Champsocephalus gunnari]|uniref:Uncharacterized protein n=1 Tax=Champsocephalus gunnari TaxID=52237 RepID=A0AAN8HLA1_CHAGU|nr:hypothetical protein CgunFtcFv8_023874 [Champsocephalus gunnari]